MSSFQRLPYPSPRTHTRTSSRNSINPHFASQVMVAVFHGRDSTVRTLIQELGVDASTADNNGWTLVRQLHSYIKACVKFLSRQALYRHDVLPDTSHYTSYFAFRSLSPPNKGTTVASSCFQNWGPTSTKPTTAIDHPCTYAQNVATTRRSISS